MKTDKDWFSGQYLYGDDFDTGQIDEWYKDEEEAFADLCGNEVQDKTYIYHELNKVHGYDVLKSVSSFDKVLGFGSSWGYEFTPILDRIKELYILDSSEQTVSKDLGNIVPHYSKPVPSGKIPYEDNTFGLITCFGVLHHIPNVTYVMNELFRVLKPGGYLLIREPIISMGDWREKRPGLTKRERGIPIRYFDNIIRNNDGVEVVRRNYCYAMMSFFERLTGYKPFLYSNWYVRFDKFLAACLAWNLHYHARNKYERIAPQCIFYVIRKLGNHVERG